MEVSQLYVEILDSKLFIKYTVLLPLLSVFFGISETEDNSESLSSLDISLLLILLSSEIKIIFMFIYFFKNITEINLF